MSVDSSSMRGMTLGRVLHSRLARRIAWSVLLAVALPLGVLAALGGQALESLDRRFAARERLAQVKSVAQQVGIRLSDADRLLAAWPAEPPAAEPGVAPQDPDVRLRLPGLGEQFLQAALLGADGRLRWSTGGWPGPLAEAATALPRADLGRSQLLAQERNGQPQLVLAQAPQADGARWLVELSPQALWQSVAVGDSATYWCVQNMQGLRLHCPAPATGGEPPVLVGAALADRVHAGWTLPLEARFGAGDWQFDMVQLRGPTAVLGPALTGPLVGGVLCALCGVLLASGGLIRRTLGPLQSLEHGTRQLEQRAPGVRVEVVSDDEFGALAHAFNRMATAVDTQFQSLELLASIDRDIVAHRAVDEVFRRVLVQSLPGLGANVMGLARVESARVPRLHLQWNDRAFVQKVRRSVRALTPQEAQALLGVTGDGAWSSGEGSLSAPWCAPMWQDKDSVLQALPLRWQGRTHGLLLLGWSAEPPPQRLREATELRDRLSVALAAHQRELELTWQARHDDLTGLLNRNGLHQELDALLVPAAAQDSAMRTESVPGHPGHMALAVLFIDLDHFKTVNDNLGHGLGDELLRQAAERLEACAPTRAVVARPGGDEFVLVLPEADDVAAIEVARAVCRRMAVPFSLGGKEHFLGASIGIALAPVHGDNRTDLLRHADMAMYTAKDAGRGRHAMFEEPLDARLLERSALLADLRQAVARKELVLHFQPRVCVADGSIVSAEALIRWRHPTRGLVAPGVFIPLAEESELIEAIGLWVIRAACAQLARWRREGVPLRRLSVNVSPRQLQSGRLMEEVEAALVQHGVPWNMLELEVTESLLVGDARSASEQLCRLRERGVLIALDDFGTGYSSMATLRTLPIDVMKVDRAFVQDLSDDPSALAVTRAILTLAQSLGKHTVAEGIETQAQADLLRQLGCDEFQGFLFSPAVPAAEFAALCRFSAQQPAALSA